jgi:translation initiation factor IF-2
MSVTGNKIRVYDLAKELKLDTKRLIEELRREGADVSVASNSVAKEIADKIRARYFPKTQTKPSKQVKVIKKEKPAKEEIPQKEEPLQKEAPVEAAETPPTIVAVSETVTTPKQEEAKVRVEERASQKIFRTSKIIKKAVVSTKPKEISLEEKLAIAEQPPVEEKPVIEEKPPEPPQEIGKVEVVTAEVREVATTAETKNVATAEVEGQSQQSATRGVMQIKQLKLRQEAVESGIKPGERVVVVGRAEREKEKKHDKKRIGRFEKERKEPKKFELRGTPGETSTPQTIYIPKPTDRKPIGRHGRKDFHHKEKKDGLEEKEITYTRPRTIEERIFEQIGKPDPNNLKPLKLTEGATVRDFAEKINVPAKDIVQFLLSRGIFATVNQQLGEKTLKEIGKDLGFDVKIVSFEEAIQEEEILHILESDDDAIEIPRAPVVTVMGHVDHGKTSLLDAIRHTNVAEGEAGGITQHIGAYSVYIPDPDNPEQKRRIVFLDTPGHEAFTMMRARGAKVTDIVILVVAADDGVMPQTIEAIEHARAAKVPIIVAINKIDKPDANVDKVKQELALQGLQPVEWGGNVEMIPVSAKKRQNLDLLLETVILQADIMELKANPSMRASGVVLEAKLDKGRGPVATVLVQQGTLRKGDPFIVGLTYGKVRAMLSDRGETVEETPPATPVEVLGVEEVPQAGDLFQVVSDIEQAEEIAYKRQMKARQAALTATVRRGIEALNQADVKELLVVLKADVQGSVEVLRSTLEKLSTDKVKVKVIRSGVGAITESDVLLASATQVDNKQTAVVIIGFNVRPEARAAEVAKQEGVDIRLHSIIYKVEEEIKAAMIGMLEDIEKEVILGKARVQETFKVSRVGTVAGCRVTNGVIRRSAKARLIRDGIVIWEGEIASLKRFKDDVNEVKEGFECGIGLLNFNDIKIGDEIEAYVIQKVAATEL